MPMNLSGGGRRADRHVPLRPRPSLQLRSPLEPMEVLIATPCIFVPTLDVGTDYTHEVPQQWGLERQRHCGQTEIHIAAPEAFLPPTLGVGSMCADLGLRELLSTKPPELHATTKHFVSGGDNYSSSLPTPKPLTWLSSHSTICRICGAHLWSGSTGISLAAGKLGQRTDVVTSGADAPPRGRLARHTRNGGHSSSPSVCDSTQLPSGLQWLVLGGTPTHSRLDREVLAASQRNRSVEQAVYPRKAHGLDQQLLRRLRR